MSSHKCCECYNETDFVTTYRGLTCNLCGSADLMTIHPVLEFIPWLDWSQPKQVKELERMHALVDGRYGEGYAHGLAA